VCGGTAAGGGLTAGPVQEAELITTVEEFQELNDEDLESIGIDPEARRRAVLRLRSIMAISICYASDIGHFQWIQNRDA
jgi:hypothetical protein